MAQEIKAKLNRQLHRKADSGWGIYLMEQADVRRTVKCIGTIAWEPAIGDRFILNGNWKTSNFDGNEEFQFTSIALDLPDNPVELLMLAVEQTKGLGDAKHVEIYALYGDDWQAHPDLDGVMGIGDHVRANWADTLERIKVEKEKMTALAWMMSRCMTQHMATVAWEAWGSEAAAKIEADCYVLAELPHYGFIKVDAEIRVAFGIADDDPRRREAAVMYVMKQDADKSGNTRMSVRDVVTALLGLHLDGALGAIERLVAAGKLERVGDEVALWQHYQNELAIWNMVKAGGLD
jgi:hypothetical protein